MGDSDVLFAVFPHSSHCKVSVDEMSRRFPQSSQNWTTMVPGTVFSGKCVLGGVKE